ncbi:isochorismatase family cysteine hydrolase [Amycolatopsis thermoflava]|uniref:isochorismatase family cysteine hydrolase n=1 Tax=Amycolatopsis thermoflava TaxID=84480 RepID=UPI003F4A4596
MSTALLVVDVQNGFCHPDGSLPRLGRELDGAAAAVANTAAAVARAREAGVPVVFTRHVYRPGRVDEGPRLAELSGGLAELHGLEVGTWDADVVDELGCTAADLVVDKARFDAFLWTSLDPLLHGLGVTGLVVCGVVTNICVESTVRAAFMRDYRVTLLEDCCAAMTRRQHEIGVEIMRDIGFAAIASIGGGFTFGALPEAA